MRAVRVAVAVVVCLSTGGFDLLTGGSGATWARPKPAPAKSPRSATKAGGAEVGTDHSLEKQSAWEQKVMGDDGGKRADMKKIAAAQKLGDDARKNPPPEPPKKYKDPNKEGARAKSEATIGLPIASDQKAPTKRTPGTAPKKPTPPSSSAHDELGALVASSLASDRKSSPPVTSAPGEKNKPRSRKSRGKPAQAAPSSLDRMFSAGQ